MVTQLALEMTVDDDAALRPLVQMRRQAKGPRYDWHTLWLRACRRCGGDMVAEQDIDAGWARVCLCCGERVWGI